MGWSVLQTIKRQRGIETRSFDFVYTKFERFVLKVSSIEELLGCRQCMLKTLNRSTRVIHKLGNFEEPTHTTFQCVTEETKNKSQCQKFADRTTFSPVETNSFAWHTKEPDNSMVD